MEKQILRALQDIAHELKKIRKIMEKQNDRDEVKDERTGFYFYDDED